MMGFRTPIFAAMLFDALRSGEADQGQPDPVHPIDEDDLTGHVYLDEIPPPSIVQTDVHSFRVGGRLARRLGCRRR